MGWPATRISTSSFMERTLVLKLAQMVNIPTLLHILACYVMPIA